MKKSKKNLVFWERIFRGFLYVLPLSLFFSYYPVIKIGASENMNFEFSIALFWLVGFDLVSFVSMILKRQFDLRKIVVKNWKWLLFPIFVTFSLFWTTNLVRGILTVGILWLIYFAVFSFFEFRDLLNAEFWRKFWRWFFGASLFVCGWCVLQCVLDLVGVSRDCSLMCAGCVTEMFGFPHPNGFAIEPQFMGNLLLAPAIVSASMVLRSSRKHLIMMFFTFVATLFLTFSRGAIYAFIVAIIFLVVLEIVKTKKFRSLVVVAISGLAFLFTLNLQGIFAQVSQTNDTYFSGVAKVLNHLSLGIIDIEVSGGGDADAIANESDDAVFDGYVEESTTIRIELTNAALEVFAQNPRNVLFGVGIGGAGESLFLAGETDSPKEIVQNEYASLLLEVGIVGSMLFGFTTMMVIRKSMKSEQNSMIFALLVAYAITLFFFSGLPNALQIYLMPAILLNYQTSLRKKLVS
ncbi:MAG: O-antigen ligase family protein [Candidatus Saccharibacteria bacterium]|nr:O-antigen ligase family protein [Candidatus Saccharibacteria bacterium]